MFRHCLIINFHNKLRMWTLHPINNRRYYLIILRFRVVKLRLNSHLAFSNNHKWRKLYHIIRSCSIFQRFSLYRKWFKYFLKYWIINNYKQQSFHIGLTVNQSHVIIFCSWMLLDYFIKSIHCSPNLWIVLHSNFFIKSKFFISFQYQIDWSDYFITNCIFKKPIELYFNIQFIKLDWQFILYRKWNLNKFTKWIDNKSIK